MTNVTVVTLKRLRIFDVAPGNKRWHFSAEFDGKREFSIASPTKVQAGEWSNVKALLKDADGPTPGLLAWIEPGTDFWAGVWPRSVVHDAIEGLTLVFLGLFMLFVLTHSAHGAPLPLLLVFGATVGLGAVKIAASIRKNMILDKYR